MLQNPQLHYLDNAATTIVAPEVADVINKAMREHWANPSSLYGPGARSEEALNAARAAVARTLGCKSRELYFTSCGSESNNLALLGAVRTRTFGKGIVVSGFEHPSVQRPLEELAKQGYNVTVVKPRPDGTLNINEMLEHVDKNTILVACMMVNNEVGTRNDVERLAAEVKRRNSRTIVHVDAVQAWMRVPIKLDNIDTLSVSGHKIHAPKGIGALYLSDRLVQAFRPPYLGGEQERGLRPGTENLPYAMGLAAAATRLAKIAGVDINEFANEMFEAGEKLDGKTAEEVFLQDFKVFMCGDIRFGVAQGSYMTRKNLKAAQKLLTPYLPEACGKQNVEDLYMLLTDVPKEESVVICTGRHADEMLRSGFEKEPEEDGSWVLPGVVSRKKQFIPALMTAYQEL